MANTKIDPFPMPVERIRKGYAWSKIVLNEQQIAWLRKYYPILENTRIMKHTTLSHSTLHRYARELGLKKSPKGDHAIRKRTGAKVKRMLEANGYYDSLRGKKAHPNAIAANKRYWQEVREGKRLSNIAKMKQDNPRKYRAMQRTMSKNRRKLIEMEKFRAMSGLKRTTKLRVYLRPYSKSQICRRYNAVHKYGYIVYDFCRENDPDRWNIYYNKDTKRAPRFERNLEKDGFHVLDGTNL